jgi:hypothetical protein
MIDGATVIPIHGEKNSHLEQLRERAHDIMDDFVDKLSASLSSDEPKSLEEISEIFQQKRTELLGNVLEELINTHYTEAAEVREAACPQCGRTIKARQKRKREVETAQGALCLERNYFHCPDCGTGFSPLDRELNLAGSRKQHDLQRKALKLLAEVPFKRASELFQELTGVPFSDRSLHELFETFSHDVPVGDVLPSREELNERIEGMLEPGKWRPVLVVTADGAMTPLRPGGGRSEKRGPGEYREVKGFRAYLLKGERIEHLASWHQVEDSDQFARDLNVLAERIPRDKVRIALIGDGASWIWKALEGAFPEGRPILDYYHCCEYVHAVAETQYGDDPDRAKEWTVATLVRLCYGHVGAVLGGLRRMSPRDDDSAEAIRKMITYPDNNRKKIRYRSARLAKQPIGSGGIESANKLICHSRLKISGAWWLKANSNGMLRLRCAIFNGTFHRAFSKHVTKERARKLLTNA